MAPAVHLHVGPVKTGSTYLQRLTWANRSDLARQGWAVPLTHDNEMWLASVDVQDGAFVHVAVPTARGAWRRVCERVRSSDRPVLLSHELLGLSTDAHVAHIAHDLGADQLHLVVMARSLSATLPSMWQEMIKQVDPDVSWPDFLAAQRETHSPWTDSAAIVQRWSAHVPAARIHVVTVPSPPADPGILLSRFAAATGIDTGRWAAVGSAANVSLDRRQVERLRTVIADSTATRTQLREYVQHAYLPRLGSPDPRHRIRIPRSHRGWIAGETQRRVNALAASGARVYGDLADLDDTADVWES